MKIALAILVILWVWIIYEFVTAPMVDEHGRIIKKKNKNK